MKHIAIATLVILLAASVALTQQAPKLKPPVVPPAAEAPPHEIVVSAAMATEYQVLDLKHQLALSQYNQKVAEFLATPEMLDLRSSLLGFQSGMRSRMISILSDAHIPPDQFQTYTFVADPAGGGKLVKNP